MNSDFGIMHTGSARANLGDGQALI